MSRRRRLRLPQWASILVLVSSIWRISTVTAGAQALTLSDEEAVSEKGIRHVHPNSHEQRRFLSSNATSTTQQQPPTKYNLPRIEVQFVCGHEIRPEFNVSEVFATFFQESINNFWNEQQRLDASSDEGKNDASNNNKNMTLSESPSDDFDLYAALSISNINDVDRQHWYFPLCNASSPQVLATMDVRGYAYVAPTTSSDGNNRDRNLHTSIQDLIDSLPEKIDSKAVRAFFEQNICQDLVFFRSKMVEWDDATFPPPSNGQHVKEYQPSNHYPNGQQHYNHHHFYDHNLYLLCGGVDDLVWNDDDDEQIDQGFLVFGMLVGVMMVAMLGTELQQYAIMGVQRRYRRAGTRNDGYANVQQVQVQPTITQEVEMV